MNLLRHSASFPTLPSSNTLPLPSSSLNAPSQPNSPLHPRQPSSNSSYYHHHHYYHHSNSSSVSSASPLPSPVPSIPAPRLPLPPPPPPPSSSPLYSFPSLPLSPPPHFARIESNLYRCSSSLTSLHQPFLLSLHLNSVLCLSDDLPSSSLHLLSSLTNCQIHFIHHLHSSSHLKSAVEYVLMSSHYPLLLLSSSSADISLLIGCLRRLQCWCYSSIIEEYERGVNGEVDRERRWEDEIWMEKKWEEEIFIEESKQVTWWRETMEKHKIKNEYKKRKERGMMENIRKHEREERKRRREQRLEDMLRIRRELKPNGWLLSDDERLGVYERRLLDRLRVESEEDAREEREDEENAKLDAAFVDVDKSFDRLFISNPQWRVISEGVKFDKKLSIIEDDED